MSTPQVPPRPARLQQQQASTTTTVDVPKIPPRPVRHTVERSRSPNRENFPMSPLNKPPTPVHLGSTGGSFYGNEGQNTSTSNLNLPKRPSVVSLPSIGQEGNEYADLETEAAEEPILDQVKGKTQPEQTRNVGSDLPLHAPRPSFSSSTNKARVSAVTRTDSSLAMAAGVGKPTTPILPDDKEPHRRPLHPKVSFSRPESSASTERPGSGQEGSDHGIPDVGIGQRVPMYPDAGDVQAPSPSPFTQSFPSGIGFHNDGSKRHHGRRLSGREVFHGPPGSYGLHGHGVVNTDQFEKSWYDKHPDALEKEEQGQYGPAVPNNRPEWALSSDDLNKLVRDTASRGAGFGTLFLTMSRLFPS